MSFWDTPYLAGELSSGPPVQVRLRALVSAVASIVANAGNQISYPVNGSRIYPWRPHGDSNPG
jgi:hypothetical protein